MENPYVLLLSFIVFCPALGAIVLTFFPGDRKDAIRLVTLGVTIAVFLPALWMALPGQNSRQFDLAAESMQSVFSYPWIPSFSIFYFMGLDGISFPLVLLTAFVCMLAMAASWSIDKYVKAYCILFLLLETGMLGVFMALDFFLFYVFWEVMLLPMYFLIGVWGGPRKEYAAIKFFLYTLVGSVLMLIAILMLYFSSDLGELARQRFPVQGGRFISALSLDESTTRKLGYKTTAPGHERVNAGLAFLRQAGDPARSLAVRFQMAGLGASVTGTTANYDAAENELVVTMAPEHDSAASVMSAIEALAPDDKVVLAELAEGSDGSGKVTPEDSLEIEPYKPQPKIHTFNLLALAAMGQHTTLFDEPILGWPLQHWAFVLLLVGFIIKVPSVPLHTWLPDAHVEAPTPISMILAAILLKMGGYGIIRICYPICPQAGFDLRWVVCMIGVVSMVYGALAAMAQRDFKRLVAYSSVSHMGYVVLGFGLWSATAETFYNSDYWNMGVKGALFQMIAHGISSAGMFFMVGVLYDRVHHRNLDQFGGLFDKMPVYTALSIGIFFAALGLPGLCGFIGEVLVVLSAWKFDAVLAVISASVVILTAGYILWTVQRVYLGAAYNGPHEEALVPITPREMSIAVPLFVLAIWLGVYPQSIFNYMDKTVDRQVRELAELKPDQRPPAALASLPAPAGRTGLQTRPTTVANAGRAPIQAPWDGSESRPTPHR